LNRLTSAVQVLKRRAEQGITMTHKSGHHSTSSFTATTALPVPFVPDASGSVDIPPVSDPRYIPALDFWSRYFGCSIADLTEAHARTGRHPDIERFSAVLKRMAIEEEFSDTKQQSTRQLARQPSTIAMPLQGSARPGRVAAWFNRRGTL